MSKKKQFKAESQRLLDLMINSIYTHKEIFLREIISNASDAMDKLCYLALTDSNVGMNRDDFEIFIKRDEDNRTLTVSDNGIGMTKDELETNLGTIARSGSYDFKKNANEDTSIIGQFGVGFYSAFMVSDKVTVISKAYGSEDAWAWESTGADGYSISQCEKDTCGTDIIMHIKENTDDEEYDQFLSEYTLMNIIKKYSDYIRFPIKMQRTKHITDDAEATTELYDDTLNSMIPIWQRQKSELTDDALNAFYKEKFFDFEDPIKCVHVGVEGTVSYKALMFIPAKAGYDMYTKDFKKGLQLYSNGVLIMDKCEDLLPDYLRFVRGVVDSPDLSLNISREILQHNRQLKTISSNIEKKLRNELLKLQSDDRDKYENFFDSFGLILKYGALDNFGMDKDNVKDLLLFPSSEDDKKLTTLSEYTSRMKEGQENIYYATGESITMIQTLPQIEVVREKGYEILYFTKEVDEFIAQALIQYNEKPFKSVNSNDLGFDEDKEALDKLQEEHKDILDFVRETLGSSVNAVRISQKLRTSPACLTAGGQLSFEMEKYLNQVNPNDSVTAERILEFNATHPVFNKLKDLIESDKDTAERYVKVLYNQTRLTAGLAIENTAEYSDLIYSLMT